MQRSSVQSGLVLTTTWAVHSVSQQRDASGKANIRWCGNVLVTVAVSCTQGDLAVSCIQGDLAVSCIQSDLGRFNTPMCAEVLFDSGLEHFQTNELTN
jgi:hypothetical protein